jgi:hypothetical protein
MALYMVAWMSLGGRSPTMYTETSRRIVFLLI